MGQSDGMVHDAYRLAPAGPDAEYVYGSCSPNWHSAGPPEAGIDRWLDALDAEGIQRVCCLLAGSRPEAANVGRYRDAFGDGGVLHAPVPDRHLVDTASLREEVLPFISEGAAVGEPVVVHCLTGVGRTGHVLAAWLAYGHGYDPEAAVETVRERGRDPTVAVTEGTATEAQLYGGLARLRRA